MHRRLCLHRFHRVNARFLNDPGRKKKRKKKKKNALPYNASGWLRCFEDSFRWGERGRDPMGFEVEGERERKKRIDEST